ncbi:MAG: glycosyltransferase [Planctomycetota bacterium]
MIQPTTTTTPTSPEATLPRLAKTPLDALVPALRPLRIVMFCKSKKHTRVPVHFMRAFRQQGHEVTWFRTHKLNRVVGGAISRAVMNWRYRLLRPDVVFIYGRDIPHGVLEAMQDDVPKVVYYEDIPGADGRTFNSEHRRVFGQASLLFTTARELIPSLRELGAQHVEFLHAGVDPEDHYLDEPDERYASEVAFIGRGYGSDRLELIASVARHCDLRVYGRGWKENIGLASSHQHIFPQQYRTICASTKIVLGIDLRSDFDLYFSNRTWLTLGCGGFLLTHYVPHLEEFFTNRRHLVWYHSTEECLDLIRHYLDHDAERKRIAAEGYRYVHRYHTFQHAASHIAARVRETFGVGEAPTPAARGRGASGEAR